MIMIAPEPPKTYDKNTWDERRKNDPQGAIDVLLAQIVRQGKTIYEANLKITKLETLLQQAGIDPETEVAVKTTKRKKSETVVEII